MTFGTKMKTVTKILAHLLFVCGLLILIILPSNKYGWMTEMDPSIVVEDSSGDSVIFSLILLLIICSIEAVVFMKSVNFSEKALSAALVGAALLTWSIKFFIA